MKITIDKLVKSFGRMKAIDDISMVIEPGQIVALLGPNGAGKTTLLRALAGLVAPDRGTIAFDDQQFNRGRIDLRKQMFFLADIPPVFPEFTPIKHAGMVFRLYDQDSNGAENRVLQYYRDLDIIPYANIPIGFLSRGQAYKSALAAALVLNPKLWLLDEPFAAGMDPNGMIAFKKYAREAASAGHTIIYSTQILEVAEGFCDRACVIHRGRLEAFNTISEIQTRVGQQEDVLAELFRQLREDTK